MLAISDVFILPSETESFGLVALEAMASKTAIISTMSQERLEGLLLLSAHRDLTPTIDEVINEFALKSYEKVATAWKRDLFKAEVCKIEGTTVEEDEEYKSVNLDKVANLRPAFVSADKGGFFFLLRDNNAGKRE